MRIGSSSGSLRGTITVRSASSGGSSRCASATTGPLRALISESVEVFLSSSSSSGTIATVGMSGLISASGPCFSSADG